MALTHCVARGSLGEEADGGGGEVQHIIPRCHHYRNCPSPHGGTELREDTTTISRDVEGNQASLEIRLAGNCTSGWKSLQGCGTRPILIHGPLPKLLGKSEASTLSRSQRSLGSPFMIL